MTVNNNELSTANLEPNCISIAGFVSSYVKSGYRVLEHPADIGIEATGMTLREAFQHAAEGLMSLILDVSSVEIKQSRSIELQATDIEQLLVKWLAEILYLYDGQDFVAKDFKISELTETTIKAIVSGEKFLSSKHQTKMDVKAITYHQLEVREEKNWAYVKVFLDI